MTMKTWLADVGRNSALLLDSLKVSIHSPNDKYFQGSAAPRLELCGSVAFLLSFACVVCVFERKMT